MRKGHPALLEYSNKLSKENNRLFSIDSYVALNDYDILLTSHIKNSFNATIAGDEEQIKEIMKSLDENY